MPPHDLTALFADLRRLTAGRARSTVADESKIKAETLKPWLRPGYVPSRKPTQKNYERLVVYVDRLRAEQAVTKGDETGDKPGVDMDGRIDAILASPIDEWMKNWRIAELSAAVRADAMREAERAAHARARAAERAARTAEQTKGAEKKGRLGEWVNNTPGL